MLTMFHLPDLPNVGYATDRERQGTDQIMTFMRDVERDRLRLLTIVIDGQEKWRRVAARVFGTTLGIGTEALDEMYRYFTLQACRPAMQFALLQCLQNPDKWRELVREAMPDIEAQRETLRLQRKWSI